VSAFRRRRVLDQRRPFECRLVLATCVLTFGVCMNSGRGELTLFTSASCFIRISSVLSFPEAVVTVDSVSIDKESEQLPSELFVLELGGGSSISGSSFLSLTCRGREGWVLAYLILNKATGGIHISIG
jgi:hypothetical protein